MFYKKKSTTYITVQWVEVQLPPNCSEKNKNPTDFFILSIVVSFWIYFEQNLRDYSSPGHCASIISNTAKILARSWKTSLLMKQNFTYNSIFYFSIFIFAGMTWCQSGALTMLWFFGSKGPHVHKSIEGNCKKVSKSNYKVAVSPIAPSSSWVI